MTLRLFIISFILLSSCHTNRKDEKRLIIFYDKSSECNIKIDKFLYKNKINIIYNMKNINSIVIGGIRNDKYNKIKSYLSKLECVYGVNDDEIMHYNYSMN
ncbi:hypothetical protein GLF_2379 [Gluconobacter frateurii NBRC 101659]|nr:hypothetical protein GLF_2379 [Gluconobacter frateurii NBRC 101659]